VDDEEEEDQAEGDGEFGGGPERAGVRGPSAPAAVVDDPWCPHGRNDRAAPAK
jgi:hypothetical protein